MSSIYRFRARRRVYLLRRIMLLLILLLLAVGLYYGRLWFRASPSTSPARFEQGDPLSFEPEFWLPTKGEEQVQIAISKAENALRQVALVRRAGKRQQVIGKPMQVADFPLEVADLPRAEHLLIQTGRLPATGEPKSVQVLGEPALDAAGGEPNYKAWRIDAQQGLLPVDYYALAAPLQPSAPTLLLIDKGRNVLWHYEKGALSATYRVATGRYIQGPIPTAANQAQNSITPLGRYTIGNKHPGLPYYKENLPVGHPNNPLGTRWLGFSVYPGDGAMVWAIHGTNDPDSIGHWISDGCIRLLNQEVEQLYEKVSVGTVIEIIDTHHR